MTRIRPTIKAAVEWIALNDEPSDLDVESVAGFISTILAADLFGIDPEVLARKIVACRVKEAQLERLDRTGMA